VPKTNLTVLVTGGAGFIGSHLCEKLLSEGFGVIAYDNLYSSSQKNITELIKNTKFKFVKGDVLDTKKLRSVIKRSDIIFHLAAILGVSKVVENPLLTMSVNIKGVENVCGAAFSLGKKKVIFTSSSEVYGKSLDNPLRENANLLFGPTHVTRWNYGLSKTLGEEIMWAYAKKGLPIIIIRVFNSYGPRGINSSYSHVIPKFIQNALAGKALPVNQDGKQSRTFTYVTDTVNGIYLASKYPRNAIFNIGSDKETLIADLAKKIIKITASKSKVAFVSEEKMYGKNFESVRKRWPDTSKAKRKLGFLPKVSLHDGLKRTFEWIRSES